MTAEPWDAKKKRWKKSFFNHPAVITAATWLAAQYIRLCHYTSRREYRFAPGSLPYMRGEKPMIYTFWHGRLMMMPMTVPSVRKLHVLISSHQDGRLISTTMRHFGFATITGSTGRGGVAALRECIGAIERGENVAFTPDGPRGPAFQLSKGTVTLAKLSGAPIIPVTFASPTGRKLGSWDRFLLARPFGKLVYAAGEPIFIPADVDDEMLETLRQTVELAMNQLVEDVEKGCRV